MTRARSLLDHPSIRAVRGTPPLPLRSDGLPVLPLPSLAATGTERAVRRLALASMLPVPALALRAVPAGWMGVLELAAHALDGQNLARGLTFLRFGAGGMALLLWPDTDEADPTPRTEAVEAICGWAEARSGDTCMAHGTPGAGAVSIDGERFVLGPWARKLTATEIRRLAWPDRRPSGPCAAEDQEP